MCYRPRDLINKWVTQTIQVMMNLQRASVGAGRAVGAASTSVGTASAEPVGREASTLQWTGSSAAGPAGPELMLQDTELGHTVASFVSAPGHSLTPETALTKRLPGIPDDPSLDEAAFGYTKALVGYMIGAIPAFSIFLTTRAAHAVAKTGRLHGLLNQVPAQCTEVKATTPSSGRFRLIRQGMTAVDSEAKLDSMRVGIRVDVHPRGVRGFAMARFGWKPSFPITAVPAIFLPPVMDPDLTQNEDRIQN